MSCPHDRVFYARVAKACYLAHYCDPINVIINHL